MRRRDNIMNSTQNPTETEPLSYLAANPYLAAFNYTRYKTVGKA